MIHCTVLQSKESEVVSSLTYCLPPSVHASLDGEDGYANSQEHLRWARRQRLIDDALTTTACPPPNRTICHVVDCWWLSAHSSVDISYIWYLLVFHCHCPHAAVQHFNAVCCMVCSAEEVFLRICVCVRLLQSHFYCCCCWWFAEIWWK